MTTATEVGFVPIRVSKVVGLTSQNDQAPPSYFVVLEEPGEDRRLAIRIGHAEAFALAASLNEIDWQRPMTYQLMADVLRAGGGRIGGVRLDALVDVAYAATIEVVGPAGSELVDARSSDALNLAVVVGAPVVAAVEVLEDIARRLAGSDSDASLLQSALAASPMTIRSIDLSDV